MIFITRLPMHIYLPKELVLDIEKAISESWGSCSRSQYRNKIDDTYFLCHYLISKIVGNEQNASLRQSASLSSTDMKKYVNKYKKSLQFLIDNYIIKERPSYSTGYNGSPSFTKSYSFFKRMDLSPVVKIELSNPYLLKKIKGWKNAIALPSCLVDYQEAMFGNIYLDVDLAENYVLELHTNNAYEIMDFYRLYLPIYWLRIGKFYFKREESGRLHHTFGGLSKRLRKFLRVKGEASNDWVEVDIGSCTPFLFGVYLLQQGYNNRSTKIFHDLTTTNDFYSELMEACSYLTVKGGEEVPSDISCFL